MLPGPHPRPRTAALNERLQGITQRIRAVIILIQNFRQHVSRATVHLVSVLSHLIPNVRATGMHHNLLTLDKRNPVLNTPFPFFTRLRLNALRLLAARTQLADRLRTRIVTARWIVPR